MDGDAAALEAALGAVDPFADAGPAPAVVAVIAAVPGLASAVPALAARNNSDMAPWRSGAGGAFACCA